MNTSSPISARVDETTLKDLDRLAEELDRSRSWLVAQAVSEYVKRETEFLEFVKVGENEIENGDFHTQGEMEAWIEDRISKRAGKEERRS